MKTGHRFMDSAVVVALCLVGAMAILETAAVCEWWQRPAVTTDCHWPAEPPSDGPY